MENFRKIVPTSRAAKGTIRYSLCLLAAVLVLNTASIAQQRNRSAATQSTPSSAASGNAAPKYKVKERDGKLILSDGRSEAVVSNDPNSSSPLVNGDKVYYIGKTQGNSSSSGSAIYVYDIKTKATEDIIAPNSQVSSYDGRNVVENLLLDKRSGKLYFSTSLKNRRGHTDFLTWRYDISAKKLAVYQDGRIERIDEIGNQTIVFEGFDSKGKFTSTTLLGTDGNLIKELGREYAAKQLSNTK